MRLISEITLKLYCYIRVLKISTFCMIVLCHFKNLSTGWGRSLHTFIIVASVSSILLCQGVHQTTPAAKILINIKHMWPYYNTLSRIKHEWTLIAPLRHFDKPLKGLSRSYLSDQTINKSALSHSSTLPPSHFWSSWLDQCQYVCWCMCVECVCMYLCICTYIWICICTNSMHICVHALECECLCFYICFCICIPIKYTHFVCLIVLYFHFHLMKGVLLCMLNDLNCLHKSSIKDLK